MRVIVFLCMLLCISACANAGDLIIQAPTKLVELQVKDDYKFLKNIFSLYPSKQKLLPLLVVIGDFKRSLLGDRLEQDGRFVIVAINSRGVWFHELCHYFVRHLEDKYYHSTSVKEEFLCEVMENLINGILPETFKNSFKITMIAQKEKEKGHEYKDCVKKYRNYYNNKFIKWVRSYLERWKNLLWLGKI